MSKTISLSLSVDIELLDESQMEIDPNITFGNPLPAATHRLDPSRCVDLIVLGINYRSNEEDVRSYFQQFGELVFCEVRSSLLCSELVHETTVR